MILEFNLSATRERVRVEAPQAEFTLELRNLAGYHRTTSQIVSIGDTAEEMQANAPEYWEKNGKNIGFLHPFRFDEPHPGTGRFEPLIAARIVQHYSNHAFGKIKRQSLKRQLLSPWVDRVDYNLKLDGFDQLPLQTRREFVKHLKKLLVAIRRVDINGETVVKRT